jgi:hypothetical protein
MISTLTRCAVEFVFTGGKVHTRMLVPMIAMGLQGLRRVGTRDSD